jgi:hypothetical protein
MPARENREDKACREEAGGKDCGGLGQGVSGASAGHEASATTANAERAPFGTLQQDDSYESQRNHDVNQQKNGTHLVAFAFEGGVLAESAKAWLAFASAAVSVGGAGLRSGRGTTSPLPAV